MCSFDAELRPTHEEVLSHPWMMGEMPTERDIVDQFTHRRIAVKEYENK